MENGNVVMAGKPTPLLGIGQTKDKLAIMRPRSNKN